jgi:glutamine synthetase
VSSAAAARETRARLQAAGARLLALALADSAGITRVKYVPISRLERVAASGIGFSDLWAVVAVDDHFAFVPPFDTPSGDFRMIPDLATAVPLHLAPGYAWAATDAYTQELEERDVCPRRAVRVQVARAAALGLDVRATFEIELSLLRETGEPVGHLGPGYTQQRLHPTEGFALDLLDALEAQGASPEQLHPEYAPGQFELSTSPSPALAAADRLLLTRYTVRQAARRHGFEASFAPAALDVETGNGCHLHLSLWRGDANLMTGGDGPAGMQAEGAAFVAGILEHLPALMALIAPSVPSYRRVQPGHWAGAYTCWGVENREAALRFIPGTISTRSRSANVELKVVDGAANPYFAVAGVLAAGLDGVERELAPPPGLQTDPATLEAADAERLQVRRLPADLGAAADALDADASLRGALGETLHRTIVATRRLEWDTFRDASFEELVAAHRFAY